MSFLASEVITDRARAIWKDAGILTYKDEQNVLWLSDAILELRSIASQSRYDDAGELLEYSDVTALSSVVLMDAKYRGVLTDYVAWRGFQTDGESEKHLARAKDHMDAFYARAKAI